MPFGERGTAGEHSTVGNVLCKDPKVCRDMLCQENGFSLPGEKAVGRKVKSKLGVSILSFEQWGIIEDF